MAALIDAKQLNRLLFGVYYEDDIYERLCDRFPGVMRAFSRRTDPAFRARNLIFVHVPRAAGMSVARALGAAGTRHYSARYFRTIDPTWFAATPSFAVLRNPYDRFLSAYAFVRGEGAEGVRLSRTFAEQTRHIDSVDSYLDFLEGRAVFDLDFVMRPQSWFVCDLKTGVPLVKNLFLLGEDDTALGDYLEPQRIGPIPWLNRSRRRPTPLTSIQRDRVERLYADDFALIDSLRARRNRKPAEKIASLAAE